MSTHPDFRIATWNVWWRNGDWQARQPAILQALRDIDADVIGFQEMSSTDPDQLAWLREELGYHVVASPDGEADRHSLVNAIASRWPIVDAVWHYLDVGEMQPHRTVLRATIDARGTTMLVYCTHLSHGFDQSAVRHRQVDQIAAMVHAERGDPETSFPPVVVGDLNAVPESDEVRRLTGLTAPLAPGLVFSDAWAQVGNDHGATYTEHNPYVVDSAWPERRLDYILVGWPRPRPLGNPVRARVFGVGPVQGVVASDHYGVVADLRAPTEH